MGMLCKGGAEAENGLELSTTASGICLLSDYVDIARIFLGENKSFTNFKSYSTFQTLGLLSVATRRRDVVKAVNRLQFPDNDM
jgi:hypothetical protein